MSRSEKIWHLLAIFAILLMGGWWIRETVNRDQPNQDFPSRPIQVVVPYAAGGGSDTFVRIIQQGIAAEGLLSQPIVVINQPGGIGTIGSREVKNADPDGYKILCHHNAIITAKLVGTVSYGPEAFEPIALTGEMAMVILVRADAPYQDILDLLKHSRESPRMVRFGANKGAPAYFAALQLERAYPGAEFSVVSSGGGADRYAKILGGHLEAGIFSLSEYLDFLGIEGTPPEQDVRAIAVLSDQRHESIPEVPTANEMGISVTLDNANYWWAPKGTPTHVLQTLSDALEAAMESTTVRQDLGRLRMDPVFLKGPALQQRLQSTIDRFEEVASQRPTSLPNFVGYVALILIALFGWVVIDTVRRRGNVRRQEDAAEWTQGIELAKTPERPGLAAACFITLCLYVLILGYGVFPFAMTTAAMVIIVGSLMLFHAGGKWVIVMELALLSGFGIPLILTEIFATPLPS